MARLLSRIDRDCVSNWRRRRSDRFRYRFDDCRLRRSRRKLRCLDNRQSNTATEYCQLQTLRCHNDQGRCHQNGSRGARLYDRND